MKGEDALHPSVYPPSEDTFALIDAITKHIDAFRGKVVLEIGCGSGEVTNFLTTNVPDAIFIATDVNRFAAQKVGKENLTCTTVRTSILDNINQSLIDIVIFNPPYISEDPNKIGLDGMCFAGGEDGRFFIDELTRNVTVNCVFVVTILKNRPIEVAENLIRKGYHISIPINRKILSETLAVIMASRSNPDAEPR